MIHVTEEQKIKIGLAMSAIVNWCNGSVVDSIAMPNGRLVDSPAKIASEVKFMRDAIEWPPGGTVVSSAQKFTNNGLEYAPKPHHLPFPGTGSFPVNDMYLISIKEAAGNQNNIQFNKNGSLGGSDRFFMDWPDIGESLGLRVGIGDEELINDGVYARLHIRRAKVEGVSVGDIDWKIMALMENPDKCYLSILQKPGDNGGLVFGTGQNTDQYFNGALRYRSTLAFMFRVNNAYKMWLNINGKLSINSGSSLDNDTNILEIADGGGGFLPPRMTTTQRDAIDSPALSLRVYNLTTHQPEHHNGTAWVAG